MSTLMTLLFESKGQRLGTRSIYHSVAKLEGMLVMHCMTNAVLEYQFYL